MKGNPEFSHTVPSWWFPKLTTPELVVQHAEAVAALSRSKTTDPRALRFGRSKIVVDLLMDRVELGDPDAVAWLNGQVPALGESTIPGVLVD